MEASGGLRAGTRHESVGVAYHSHGPAARVGPRYSVCRAVGCRRRMAVDGGKSMNLQPVLTKGTFKGKTWVSKAVVKKLRTQKCRVGELTYKPRGTVYRFYFASLADVRR